MLLDSLLLLEIQSLPTLDSRVQEHFILTFSSSLQEKPGYLVSTDLNLWCFGALVFTQLRVELLLEKTYVVSSCQRNAHMHRHSQCYNRLTNSLISSQAQELLLRFRRICILNLHMNPQFQLLYVLECKKPLALKQSYFIFLRDKFKN